MDTSIFYYVFHIKLHLKKKYFEAISGQIFMKFISRHAEIFEFYYLSDSNFWLHGFCLLVI